MTKYKYFLLLIFYSILFYSCSKKNEEITLSNFSIDVQSDFLLSTQKAYYLFTNNEGDILSEGSLENGKQYVIPSFEEEVHFTYILSTPPDPQLATIIAITYVDINVSNNLVLHKGLNSSSALVNADLPKGQANVRIDCFGGLYYTSIATKSDIVLGVEDNQFPRSLNLFDSQEEALALRTTVYPPTSANQFLYAIKNIQIGQENPFLCEDFQDASQKVKSITMDVGRTRNIGSGYITFSAIPDGFVSPNPLYTFGTIDRKNFNFNNSQTATLWYLEDWVKSNRKYMRINSQTIERGATNDRQKVYTQVNHGLFPPPSVIRLEIPTVSIDIQHSENKSLITQSGEQFIGGVQYQRKGERIQNNKLYGWILNFAGNKQQIEWIFPKLSNQLYSHLGIDKNVFESEMIPIQKDMAILEGYNNYDKYVKETFTPYDFTTSIAPANWQKNHFITEYISSEEGGVIPHYEIDIFHRNK